MVHILSVIAYRECTQSSAMEGIASLGYRASLRLGPGQSLAGTTVYSYSGQ